MPEGVIKVRDVMRHGSAALSWNAESLNKIKGTPRKPHENSEDSQVYAKVKAPTDEEPLTEGLEGEEGIKQVRRYRMNPEVLKKLGLWDQSCNGCRAIRDGRGSSNHTEECPARFNRYMEQQDSEEFRASQEKMLKYYEEQCRDRKRKRILLVKMDHQRVHHQAPPP